MTGRSGRQDNPFTGAVSVTRNRSRDPQPCPDRRNRRLPRPCDDRANRQAGKGDEPADADAERLHPAPFLDRRRHDALVLLDRVFQRLDLSTHLGVDLPGDREGRFDMRDLLRLPEEQQMLLPAKAAE